jgi:hypothetical protein
MQRIRTDDAGVMVRIAQRRPHTGKMQVKVQSAVMTGRATVYTLHDAARLSEQKRRQAVMKVAAMIAVRQNELWGDNHDPEIVMRKADDAHVKLMRNNRPVAAIGLFTSFEPLSEKGPHKKTSEIASRASEDDPLTKDWLKGKRWDS